MTLDMAVVIASDLGKDVAGEPLLRGISFKLLRRDRMTLSGRSIGQKKCGPHHGVCAVEGAAVFRAAPEAPNIKLGAYAPVAVRPWK